MSYGILLKMSSKQLLPIGTMVRCRAEVGHQLILWASHAAKDVDDVSAYVNVDEVLVVLKSRRNLKSARSKNPTLSDEWKKGAYLLMSSSGSTGWIGEGWVVPV